MWLNKHKVYIACILLSLVFVSGFAQNEISNPYSKYGIGLLTNISPGPMDAMGKVGYAMQDPYQINFKNPASYVAFDSLSFIADVAFGIYSSTLKTSELSQKYTFGRPEYITIGLPVTKHWRTSAGVLPFSNLGYSIADSYTSSQLGTVNYAYEGKGGLIQLYWGNAFKIWKGLSIGLNASYLFGTLANSRSAEFSTTENYFHSMINSNTDVDGIYLSAGLQYFTNIRNNHTLGIGLVYENSAYIWARQTDLVYNYSGLGANKTLNDTVEYMLNRTNMQLPQTIGGGLSYQYKKQWWFTADVMWQNWTKYRLDGNKDNSLQDALSTSFGVQVIPNIDASSYLKKIRIRAGVRYSTGYLVVNDKTIDSYGVSFGLDFPLKLFNSNSTIGVMAEYGQMGTIKNELLKENYFRFSFHFTLQERWYQRAKLE